MTNFNLDDLYQIVLDRLRKDRKGAVSPEEFESFLNNRSYDYFQQQMGVEGLTKMNQKSLAPFLTLRTSLTLQTVSLTSLKYVSLGTPLSVAQVANVRYSTTDPIQADAPKIDLVTNAELLDRMDNAVTKPTATDPVGCLYQDGIAIFGPTTGYVFLDYYARPTPVYFDYYTDGDGNVTYLTEGQAAYTLATGEVSRDGSIATQSVTSASAEFEWEDEDAMNILDMVMTDVGVAQNDQATVQTSMTERQNNVKS